MTELRKNVILRRREEASRRTHYHDPAGSGVAETLAYGAWRSPITSDLIVGETIGLGDIMVDGGDIYWIEGRPREGGRNVVVRPAPGGGIEDLTPAPFSARTRVHEYGGGAATVAGGFIFFSNFADQR